MPGLCVVFGTLLPAWAIYIIAGFFACRVHLGIKKWITQENLMIDEVASCPERGENYGLLGQFYLTIVPLHTYQPFMINMLSYLLRKACVLAPRSWQQKMNLAAYLCKIGHVDEGLALTRETIDLLKKYASDREKPLIAEMEQQHANWTKIGKDMKLREELAFKERIRTRRR
jgi:hypothetical protein